jgi:hypothetical protein
MHKLKNVNVKLIKIKERKIYDFDLKISSFKFISTINQSEYLLKIDEEIDITNNALWTIRFIINNTYKYSEPYCFPFIKGISNKSNIRGIGRELFFEIYDNKIKNILLIINFNFFNQINKIKDYSLYEKSSRNYINKYSLIENILD